VKFEAQEVLCIENCNNLFQWEIGFLVALNSHWEDWDIEYPFPIYLHGLKDIST
jgi:hypothetical protein